ncbi:DUF3577 domain-containing protein [Gilvimarinus polysaccharolyticus]|uniref:DUF3577 domain-containing protein n=1 Tax=Gilvimarinus polysaccharolyticus TaxID=863921 RepID=UPI000673565D|nr:DUF3577 domain-containing protein [Gilvimarinus polysaccharolyticus]
MSYNQSNDNRYFNLHLEGFANLYDARMINPKQGQSFEPFLQVRATFLQGKADDAQPIFVDLKVTGKKAKKIIEKFQPQIANRDIKVNGVLKAGDLRFTIGNPKAPGQEHRVFTSARLLSVKYLKVDGQQIELSQFDDVDSNANSAYQPQQANPTTSAIVPDRVTLDPAATDFAQRKAELVAAGYTWNRDDSTWVAPQENKTLEAQASVNSQSRVVKLDKNQPDFDARKTELKSQGYKWDREQTAWVLPAA